MLSDSASHQELAARLLADFDIECAAYLRASSPNALLAVLKEEAIDQAVAQGPDYAQFADALRACSDLDEIRQVVYSQRLVSAAALRLPHIRFD